jgi:hypothetical protein
MKKNVSEGATVKIGDKIKVWWFTGAPDNFAEVIAVAPYRGRYKEHFNCVLTLRAPTTKSGTLDMAIKA